MSLTHGRVSRIASSCPKEFDFQYFIFQNEGNYPLWLTKERLLSWVYSLPENAAWSGILSAMALFALLVLSADVLEDPDLIAFRYIDYGYNVQYVLDTIAHLYYDCHRITRQELPFRCYYALGYMADSLSYVHFASQFFGSSRVHRIVKLVCYYLRMHRPVRFLTALRSYNLRGGVFGTLLKYLYLFVAIRLLSVNVFTLAIRFHKDELNYGSMVPDWLKRSQITQIFAKAMYLTNKMFFGIGVDLYPENEKCYIIYLVLMISGTLVVSGITIASMSLVIGIYMQSEEIFRARFRIILNLLKTTHVPLTLSEKVETFYRMYWQKQKAVHGARLIPLFPPTLKNAITTDIFFEAQQKSRVLCDLSYQFLVEVANFMRIVHYVPGDIIIRRETPKSTMVYISFGDVEMLTAEDDMTPILRFTRGTILNPCGMCVEVAGSRSHVCVRAATFCTAHLLDARDLWRVAVKHGKTNGQTFILHSAFHEQFEKIKRHYSQRPHPPVKYKSSILMTKRNLIALKEATDGEGKPLLYRNDMFLEIAGCYMMRNEENTELTSDADPICLRPDFPWIFQPNSSLLISWQVLVAFLTMIVVFVHPYHLIFLQKRPQDFIFFDYIMSSVFIVDTIVSLSIGTKLEEGVPLTFMQTASKNVRSVWFVVDVLAVLPFFEFVSNGQFTSLNKIIKVLKVFKLLKEMESVFIFSSNTLRFISFVIIFICSTFFLASALYYLICFEFGLCQVHSMSSHPYWMKADNKFDDSLAFRFTMYWTISIQTFTAHKDEQAATNIFKAQVGILIVLEICCIIHILMEATFSASIMVTTHMRSEFNDCIYVVKDFFSKNNMEEILRYRFINYLKLCWYTDKAYSITHKKRSILYDLPLHVYQEITALQMSKYLLCVPCMKLLSKEELKKLSAHSRVFYTSPNEILQNTGEISNEIYIIKQGICEVLNPVTKKVSRLLSYKDFFGDFECIMRLPSFYTVRAVTHVQMISIARKDLIKSISIPKIVEAMRYARQQPEYSQLQKRRESFVKYEIPTTPPNVEKFPLPRKHIPDTAFQLPFTRLGFFSILRYFFPRFTIRPDGRYLKRWEWFRAACACASAFFCPMYTLWHLQYPKTSYYFVLWLDCMAYFDIIQRLLVGYYDEKGILVYHPASTAAHYLKGPVFLDLASSLPLENLDSVRNNIYFEVDSYRVTSVSQYLMCNRLGQLYRVPNAMDILNDYTERQDVIFLIKSLPIILGLLSAMTCFVVENMVRKYRIVTESGGFRLLYRYTEINSTENFGMLFHDIVGYDMLASPAHIILTGLYWVTYEVTTVGFDIFQPINSTQLGTLIIGGMIGSMLTTFVAVTVLSIRSNVNQQLASYQTHIKDMNNFMNREKMNKELQQEVIFYYEYKWDKTSGTDYRSVLKLCDQITLRTDAILHIYGPTFSKCPLLYKCDQSLLRIMGRAVYSVYYRAHMNIAERGEVISDLYIVDYGVVEMKHARDDTHTVTKLHRGSVFGNMDNVEYAVNPNRFVSSANLHLLKINAVIFHKIIADFPSVKVLLLKYRPNDENFILGSVREQSVVAATWRDRMMMSNTSTKMSSGENVYGYLQVRSKFVQIYLIMVSILCVFGDTYNVGFQYNHIILIGILYFLDFCFLFKIVLNCAFPYIEDEELESEKAATIARKRYLYGEFRYDILSILPIELFSMLKPDPWKIFAFLRLNRVLRLTTVNSCLQRYHQKLFINLTITTISSVVIWFTLFIHISTCIWYYLSIGKGFDSWIYNGNQQYVCKGHTQYQFNSYICSLYFIISTFTQNGIGDILPRQEAEVVFVIILSICSMMLLMLYVGEFSNIIQYQSFQCFNFYHKYLQLKNFLAANRVARNLVTLTQQYTLYLWREAQGNQLPHFLESAPQCLRLKLMSAAYMHHLMGHPTFRFCEPAFLRHLAGSFKPFLYVEGMWVVKEGEITNAMYFVHRGRVQEMDEEMERNLDVYLPGMFFGTGHGLFPDVPYTLSYKTVIKSQILTLPLKEWQYLLDYFPKTKNIIYKGGEDRDKDFSEFITGAADEKADKEKKRVQITKAPTVHTLKGLESQLNLPPDRKGRPSRAPDARASAAAAGAAAAGTAYAGMSSPRDSDTPTDKRRSMMKDEENPEDSPWPMHTRRRSSDLDEKETALPGVSEVNEAFPKPKKRFVGRQSAAPQVEQHGEEIELQQHMSSVTEVTNDSVRPKEMEIESKRLADNRRKSSTIETGPEIVDEKWVSEEELHKTMYDRRKSTMIGIDKSAINKELDSIKLSTDYTESPVVEKLKVPDLSPQQESPLHIASDILGISESQKSITYTKSNEEIALTDEVDLAFKDVTKLTHVENTEHIDNTEEIPLLDTSKIEQLPLFDVTTVDTNSMSKRQRSSIEETELQKITYSDQTLGKTKSPLSREDEKNKGPHDNKIILAEDNDLRQPITAAVEQIDKPTQTLSLASLKDASELIFEDEKTIVPQIEQIDEPTQTLSLASLRDASDTIDENEKTKVPQDMFGEEMPKDKYLHQLVIPIVEQIDDPTQTLSLASFNVASDTIVKDEKIKVPKDGKIAKEVPKDKDLRQSVTPAVEKINKPTQTLSLASVISNIVFEDEKTMVPRDDKIAEKVPQVPKDKDSLVTEQEEKNKRKSSEKREQSKHFESQDKTTSHLTNYHLEPLARSISELTHEMHHEAKEKRSALQFKDTIEAVEISNFESTTTPKEEVEAELKSSASRLQSIISFMDDMEMKETKVPPELPTTEKSSGSVRYGGIQEKYKDDDDKSKNDSDDKLARKAKSLSVWDVEEYMANASKKAAKKAEHVEGKKSSDDARKKLKDDDSDADHARKVKSMSVWDVEEYMANKGKKAKKGADDKKPKVEDEDDNEDIRHPSNVSIKFFLDPKDSDVSLKSVAIKEKPSDKEDEVAKKTNPWLEDRERDNDKSGAGPSGT